MEDAYIQMFNVFKPGFIIDRQFKINVHAVVRYKSINDGFPAQHVIKGPAFNRYNMLVSYTRRYYGRIKLI